MKAMKKGGVFAVLVLAAVVLLATCVEPLNFQDSSGANGSEPGKASIRINIGASEGMRTIFPAGLPTYHYTVEFLHATTNRPETAHTSGGSVANITPGQYTIRARAYSAAFTNTADSAVNLVAEGEVGNVQIGIGTNTAQTIPMTVVVGENNSVGTFAWNLTLPTGNDQFGTATLDIRNSAGTSLTGYPLDLLDPNTNNNSQDTAIPSGYYTVYITMTKQHHMSVTIPIALHVFTGHTSTLTQALTALSPNTYTVNYFDEAGVSYETGTYDETHVEHGETLTAPTEPDPLPNGDTFNGWWTQQAGGVEWVFGNSGTRINSNTNLYAQFAGTTGSVGITLEFTIEDDDAVINDSGGTPFTGTSFTQAQVIAGGAGVTFTVTVADFANYQTIELLYNGTPIIASSETGLTIANGVITLVFSQASNYGYSTVAEHNFAVRATADGTPFTAPFIVTVTNGSP